MLDVVNVEAPRSVVASDLQERKVSKDQAKDKNAWKSFLRKHPHNLSMEKRY